MSAEFAIGSCVLLVQPFNATVARIVRIDRGGVQGDVAVCEDAYDLFGKLDAKFVRIPLGHARAWSGEPRRLGVQEALGGNVGARDGCRSA